MITERRENFEHAGYSVSIYPAPQTRHGVQAYAANGQISMLTGKYFGVGAFDKAKRAIVAMIDRKTSGS